MISDSGTRKRCCWCFLGLNSRNIIRHYTWSEFSFDPALSRNLDWRPAEGPFRSELLYDRVSISAFTTKSLGIPFRFSWGWAVQLGVWLPLLLLWQLDRHLSSYAESVKGIVGVCTEGSRCRGLFHCCHLPLFEVCWGWMPWPKRGGLDPNTINS